MLNNVKACLFDMDGTLIASMHIWKDIDIEFLAKFGYDLPPTLQREIEGMSFKETAHYFKEKFALPLSIALALASGVNPATGISPPCSR